MYAGGGKSFADARRSRLLVRGVRRALGHDGGKSFADARRSRRVTRCTSSKKITPSGKSFADARRSRRCCCHGCDTPWTAVARASRTLEDRDFKPLSSPISKMAVARASRTLEDRDLHELMSVQFASFQWQELRGRSKIATVFPSPGVARIKMWWQELRGRSKIATRDVDRPRYRRARWQELRGRSKIATAGPEA